MPQTFSTLDEFSALLAQLPAPDSTAKEAASARNAVLTKPPGALGRLEDIAIWYAGWRGEAAPQISAPQVLVFAGNHGVVAQGVSAFPAEVTAQMVGNFAAGGAAINQLCAVAGARLNVIALDLETPTADFTQAPAMSEAELVSALLAGWEAVDLAADLLVVGEMGIGNTTSAAAIALALFGGEAGDWAGRGTGVDDEGLARKVDVINKGVKRQAVASGLEVLRCLGGREIAAMAGAIARARLARIPVVLDGFICTAAAACLHKASLGALDHCLAGHVSDESAHGRMLEKLGKSPLLDLGLRLGEGSGGALAINIVKAALACHSGMATFDQAGVSQEK
ncbi:MAG: nicotinate-nucleotide--dimethylbenzimidazole phosphoribosyltransferase [Rhodobacteraceae bacterium]|nr:nicotinate-nucleotide--dimethylbenzimidazole phosphoribosyltransferase [Paracoccaceae bacterium]